MHELRVVFPSSDEVRFWPKKAGRGANTHEEAVLVVVGNVADEAWKAGVRVWQGGKEQHLLERLKRLTTVFEGEVLLVGVQEREMVVLGKGVGGVYGLRKGEMTQIFSGGEAWQAKRGEVQAGDRWVVGRVDQLAGRELLTTRAELWPARSEAAAMFVVSEAEEKQPKLNPTVYLKGEKREKVAMVAGLVLLVLLGVSVALGWQKREANRLRGEYEAVVAEAEQLAREAGEVEEANPSQARSLMEQAVQLLEEKQEYFADEERWAQRLGEEIQQMKKEYEMVAGLTSVEGVSPWFDLGAVREDIFGEVIVEDGGVLAILDKSRGVVVTVTVEDKQGSLVSGGNLLLNGLDLAFANGRGVVLTERSVVEVSTKEKTSAVLVESPSWERAGGVGLFAGNVYVVDVGKGDILRYPGLSSGVGAAQSWFGPGVQPDLSGLADMAIDGDIWLVYESGEVRRYRQGAVEPFQVQDVEGEMKGMAAIETGEERVYLLQPEAQRVVVLNKEGEYQRQIVWEGLAAATDIAVNEEESTLFVLSGSSIYALDL